MQRLGLVKKRTVAYLLVRIYCRTKRFAARWWLWLVAGFVLVLLAIIAWGVFADV